MFYTNSCLQHENLNQDEWLDAENWVTNFKSDANDKITVFSGPIYSLPDVPMKVLQPPGRAPAEIPAGFYKVVSYIEKGGALTTNAFVYAQNTTALKDKQGRYMKSFTSYQVTTTEIQEETGIIFPDILKTSNKEVVSAPPTIIDPTDPNLSPMASVVADPSQIIIAAALVNPKGDERKGEWVSIANYSPTEINLDGWMLSDSRRKPLSLSGKLSSGDSVRLQPLKGEDGGQVILANSGGSLILKDPNGSIVDRVTWSRAKEEEVIVFNPL